MKTAVVKKFFCSFPQVISNGEVNKCVKQDRTLQPIQSTMVTGNYAKYFSHIFHYKLGDACKSYQRNISAINFKDIFIGKVSLC